ncbi:hypothetical protein ACTXT7_011954 [Hymenolepis weldensis]
MTQYLNARKYTTLHREQRRLTHLPPWEQHIKKKKQLATTLRSVADVAYSTWKKIIRTTISHCNQQ